MIKIIVKEDDKMIIRKVKIDDYDEIVNLYRQLYDAEKIFDNNLIDNY